MVVPGELNSIPFLISLAEAMIDDLWNKKAFVNESCYVIGWYRAR